MNKFLKVIKNSKESNIVIGLFVLTILCILLTLFLGKSFATLLENDSEVEPNSQLVYYLKVSYDGIDRNGIVSSNSVTSNIYSKVINVEDKIPAGLEFIGFVTTSDGSIGAVERSNGAACIGKVIDDTNEEEVDTGVWNNEHTEYTYHGLHYDVESGMVSFKVKNLKAGCDLTVGIITKTPSTVDDPLTPEREVRRDFYNFATAWEGSLTVDSNTVHAFMGKEIIDLYNVQYKYVGDVPLGAPAPPNDTSYAQYASVNVASSVNVEGYTFNNWDTNDVNIENRKFRMPSHNVTLNGSFTKNAVHNVTYSILGDIPNGYVIPEEQEYAEGTTVCIDSMDAGTILYGYKFLGWNTLIDVEDGCFIMPNEDVIIKGRFELVKYQIIYQFYDTVLPPNYEDYLPDTVNVVPGDTITLENVKGEPEGYSFLGWYHENEFIMPEHDLVVYGEWRSYEGLFRPTITKEVISNKNYYHVGDTVRFKVTITNTADFPIRDILVRELNDNSTFISGEGYSILSNHTASIPTISANSSIDLYANYVVLSSDSGTIENSVQLTGALADNGYILENGEYIASAEFSIQSSIKVCKTISGSYNENVFQFKVYSTDGNYETWLTLGNNECETIYVDPGTYKVKEIVPQEYNLLSVTGSVTSDDTEFEVELDNEYIITYENKFIRKSFYHSFGRIVNRIIQGG